MPCEKHRLHLDALADNGLNENQIEQLWQLLNEDNCQQCMQDMQNIIELRQMAENWQPITAPSWDATPQVTSKDKLSWNWLNLSSFACSALALLLVLFKFEVHTTESGVLFSFAGQAQSQIIQQQVHQQFSQLQQQQTAYIDTRLNNFASMQNDRNMKLISTAVELNRNERRQEMGLLVNYWQANQPNQARTSYYKDSVNYLPLTDQDIQQLSQQNPDKQE